ncbi:16654_t:CDS:2 [Acaulospora colombiana]|uniref:16654_t:CDS:1 n=1 Tax=Acaulospora colombiana TaxID=27376 RepID=A0ACA9MC36_9GLOM|nr:16654_t:CDS:2 [Acaulospora colombiana]
MATLTRPKEEGDQNQRTNSTNAIEDLSSTVPSPFPSIQIKPTTNTRELQAPERPSVSIEGSNTQESSVDSHAIACTSKEIPVDIRLEEDHTQTVANVLPSISQVENSCLIALNTLLANARPHFPWAPILPPRRHSMPSPTSALPSTSIIEQDITPALNTLLSNLRSLAGEEQGMIQIAPESMERSGMISELHNRVNVLADTLVESDAQLAKSLVSLLAHVERLTQIQPDSLHTPDAAQLDFAPDQHSLSIYDTLNRQVSHLKAQRTETEGNPRQLEETFAVRNRLEQRILWDRIDDDLEVVSRLCRRRMNAVDPFADDFDDIHRAVSPSLPPEYDPADYEPPEYRISHEYSLLQEKEKEKKPRLTVEDDRQTLNPPRSSTVGIQDEKMRLEFEAVTMAIDRLYQVAPQLHNQRVELKKKKLEEMERASKATAATSSTVNGAQRSRSGSSAEKTEFPRIASGKGKSKLRDDERDLDNMLLLIGKASSRRLNDQAVIMTDDMKSRIQKAKQQDDEDRRKFVEQLATHSDAGRLHNQDATIPSSPRIKDPDALLTLPEFIREAVPPGIQTTLNDPNALLTLPEFVRESQQMNLANGSTESNGSNSPRPSALEAKEKKTGKSLYKHRSKSFSSASGAGAWLISKGWMRQPSSLIPNLINDDTSKSPRSQGSIHTQILNISSLSFMAAGLNVTFVAEFQEYLNTVIILFKLDGLEHPPKQVILEVVPNPGEGVTSGDRILVKHGASWSPPLLLPTRVLLGKFTAQPTGDHYEIKLETPASPQSTGSGPVALLDAVQLTNISPSSFVCSSCSLPLAQNPAAQQATSSEQSINGPSPPNLTFKDLPSEYWAELVDAWMCHQDQKLTERITQGAKEGFWPAKDECLVGGSYLLFEGASIIKSNTKQTDKKNVSFSSKPVFFGATMLADEKKAFTGLSTSGHSHFFLDL